MQQGQFGIQNLGIYFYFYALIKVLSVPSMMGMNRAAVLFYPLYINNRDQEKFSGFTCMAITTSLIGGGIISVLAYVIYKENCSTNFPPYFFIFLPLLSLAFVLRGLLKGLKLIFLAIMPTSALYETIIASAACSLAFTKIFISWAILFVPICSVLLIEFSVLFKYAPFPILSKRPKFDFSTWFGSSLPMMTTSCIKIVHQFSNVLILYFLNGKAACAVYMVAQSFAKFASIPVKSLSIGSNPYIAVLKKDDIKGLQSLVTESIKKTFTVLFVILLILFVSGKWVLSFFGAPFESGYLCLCVLALSSSVGVFSGFGTSLLNMAGYGKKQILPLLLAASFQITLGIILIPKMGIEGAAIALLLTRILSGLWTTRLCYQYKLIGKFSK